MIYRVEYYVDGVRMLTGLTTFEDAAKKAEQLQGKVIVDDSDTWRPGNE